MLIERKGYKFESDILMKFWEGATRLYEGL